MSTYQNGGMPKFYRDGSFCAYSPGFILCVSLFGCTFIFLKNRFISQLVNRKEEYKIIHPNIPILSNLPSVVLNAFISRCYLVSKFYLFSFLNVIVNAANVGDNKYPFSEPLKESNIIKASIFSSLLQICLRTQI